SRCAWQATVGTNVRYYCLFLVPPSSALVFFFSIPPPPSSTLFPYTTLFRSLAFDAVAGFVAVHVRHHHVEDDDRWIVHRPRRDEDRKSTRLNSSHRTISYAVFCLKKKKKPPT